MPPDYTRDPGACGNGMTSEIRANQQRAAKQGATVLKLFTATAATLFCVFGAAAIIGNKSVSGPRTPNNGPKP